MARLSRLGSPFSFVLHTEAGESLRVGAGEAAFHVHIRSPAGRRALRSLNELNVAAAYIHGDIEIQGDLIAALSFRQAFSDRNRWIKAWRRLAPWLFGRERFNPAWIAKHYDLKNIQFFATDARYRTYTPGIYERDEDSLEEGGERKLDFAFRSLGLKPGQTTLDVGCGWGGFLRMAAERGVRATGITLSHDQHRYVENLIQSRKLDAEVLYQDFFTFRPGRTFDAITMMGVMEDLSDYRRVMQCLPGLLEPGGRVYLDFATSRRRFDTSTFLTQYVWPGTFRLVYLPELMDAINESPLEIGAMFDDRHNYYLWARGVYERWMENEAAVVERAGVELWRTLRVLFAGTAALMSSPATGAGARRLTLELPASGHWSG